MSNGKRVLLMTAAAAVALSLGAIAEARGHRRAGSERVHARSELAPADSSTLRVARDDASVYVMLPGMKQRTRGWPSI